MMTFKFDPECKLIVFNIWLKYRFVNVFRMALDTAATITVVTPEAIQAIGFDFDTDPTTEEVIITATQPERVKKLIIPELSLSTEKVLNLEVVCMKLPKTLGVSGLLGLNFLRNFKIFFDFGAGVITFDRVVKA